jgi:hypothetical protein
VYKGQHGISELKEYPGFVILIAGRQPGCLTRLAGKKRTMAGCCPARMMALPALIFARLEVRCLLYIERIV